MDFTKLSSISSSSSKDHIQLPPGFRFYPTDEELILHYLKKKIASSQLPASIIADVDLYKFNPWELPKKALFGEDEWFFFSPRDKKYPNGARPNRAAGLGYWKATGTDKPILTSNGVTIGVKKALVFYKGRPPKGIKTDWIMHEYRLLDTMLWNPKRNGSMRLDDWVLCRVRQKSNNISKNIWEERKAPSGYEPSRHSYKVNELLETNMDLTCNLDTVKNYLYTNCPMLPYIFSSLPLETTTEASSISFQSNDNSCISIYEANCDDHKNLKFLSSISSLENLQNPPKRKFDTTNHEQSSAPAIKKLAVGDNLSNEDMITCGSEEDGCDVSFFRTEHNQSDDNNLGPNYWDSLVKYQELNQLLIDTGTD